MDYLIRFSQSHEAFHLAEIEALAVAENLKMEIISYSSDVRLFQVLMLQPFRPSQVAPETLLPALFSSGHYT